MNGHDLICIFGDCGLGKSSLLAHFADEYIKKRGVDRWELSEKIIREQNVGRSKPLSFPTAPPIYSNLALNLKDWNGNPVKIHQRKGKEVGINIEDGDNYKTMRPAHLLLMDESHGEFASKGENLPMGQRSYFLERRHDRAEIILAAPRAVMFHKDIRGSGAYFIEIRSQEHEKDIFDNVYHTVWHCREWSDRAAIEEYIKTDGTSGGYIETEYEHHGNIFELYDSYAFASHFMPKDGKDFDD